MTLLRADQYIKIGVAKLRSRVVKFGGFSSESNNNLGEFATKMAVLVV